ncbi:GntR family transcriptional regulator [Weissella tructae]|jgi:GntR family transcriptional regulator|uniref:YvoA protein n=2 Tax=Weissella TaxID=46255 RepID=A0A075TXK9_9LACO|nr:MULTISPECIES: GntR family transcriptional regulator [Weissella]AIG65051.1 YvoA protein [Weissella tructae]AIM62363.1 YvoA protein [Weissella ceti]AIM63701.1 YvoA protein [Weissella ceti]ELA07757.1 GntR family transcriptional regulator [Weissella ceti NC36]QVV91454.1 GntR family transcriptional regulator [Weissella tructae]
MKAPVYVQIHDDIREAIDAGRWQAGDKIPSERELADQFDVSRMTLRQAVMLLVDEGVLERRVGSGTYVAEQKVQETLNGLTSFTDLMAAIGKVATTKTISYHIGQATASEQKRLNMNEGDNVLRMERVRYGNDEPIAFEVAAIPARLVRGLSRESLSNSLYHTLEVERDLHVNYARQTVTAAAVTERVADLLDIKRSDPVLVLRQTTFAQNDEPFEYVRTQYVGSRFEFYLER